MLQVRNTLLHINKSTGAFAIAIKRHFGLHFSFPAVCVLTNQNLNTLKSYVSCFLEVHGLKKDNCCIKGAFKKYRHTKVLFYK